MSWLRKSGDALLQIQHQQLLLQESIWARWYRKPRWVPIAKTKLFRIPPRPVVPKAEVEEMKRLHNHYRTQMKAVRAYFVNEYKIRQESRLNIHSEEYQRQEQMHLDRCFAMNDEWNRKIAEEREAREIKRKEQRESFYLKKIESIEREERLRIERAERAVQKAMEQSKTFINLENLDQAIQDCLNNEIDYNFAIDLEGNYYRGRFTNPENITSKMMDDILEK